MNFDKIFAFCERNNLTQNAMVKWIGLSALTGLAVTTTTYLIHQTLLFLLTLLSPKSELLLLVLLIDIVLFVSISYFFALFKIKKLNDEINSLNQKTSSLQQPPEFIKEFGVLWDNEANPQCPYHNILLQFINRAYFGEALKCQACTSPNNFLILKTENGASISFKEARKQVLEMISKKHNFHC